MRGPIHIIALTVETSPRQIKEAITFAPRRAEDVRAGDDRDLLFSHHLGRRRRAEKDGVRREVKGHDQHGPQADRKRNGARRIAHFAHDVGRGVPSRIGIHDPIKADRERRAENQRPIGFGRQKRDWLRRLHPKTRADDHEDERDLENGGTVLKGAAQPQVP